MKLRFEYVYHTAEDLPKLHKLLTSLLPAEWSIDLVPSSNWLKLNIDIPDELAVAYLLRTHEDFTEIVYQGICDLVYPITTPNLQILLDVVGRKQTQ